jgi:Protein of unknown function (DUF1761)
MEMHHLHITNPWAIVVSALIQWVLGALWYSPALFAKPWMAMLGISPDPSKRKSMVFGMISSFVGSLILSFVLWHEIMWSGAAGWAAGAFLGFLNWLGFIAAPNFAQGIYEGRHIKLFLINTGYWLVGMLITGALLAVWR